ncbi:hypothetical protein F5X68DRAFT_155841 [Plectosphaerella plurivora]|uniref:PhoD-like phosphatase domain-containing protein n=1 Tax=Plectosphaerella plurivora TaxID=936078 RepID=A0A9P9A8W9_9PEZI|nr:hypothetical protein F5X68DRAFT_155841 [Plectosphaerella plurivora]
MSSNAEKLDDVGRNPYASSNRWRHQESSAYRSYAGQHVQPRDPQEKGTTNDLAEFLNRDRVEPETAPDPDQRAANFKPIMIGAAEADHQAEPRDEAHTDGIAQDAPSDGKDISMRIMFHSCNGFSVGTDEDEWCGPALWNDVVRRHAQSPFHVMVGGGDQIYNDGIRVDGPLRAWTNISNPKKRRHYPFPEKLRQACDDYYLKNYIKWYSTGAFAEMNGQIPQVNIWDDHDIIDGFGSYVDDFMRCDVFRGIGGTAHKYYMIFQHHLPPPPSTYTTDHGESLEGPGQGEDPNQLMDTYVAPSKTDDCYIVGSKHGPYVAEHSHNIYCRLGARVAMAGIDARTERTRHQVNYPETYDQIFQRVDQELEAAGKSDQPIKHLILLLGIPIAYPRLTWLENVFRSPLMGPVKLLNRRFGFAGGLFNQFDGSIDLLDDLDDHYTARTHKKERAALVERLQDLAAKHSVRVTILGGDVHLAALGRFYSNPKLHIAAEEDHRYMANVVSSAITNKPPPAAVANLLARRNKIHHLNHDTDETLLTFFDKDPGESNKTAGFNQVTMPSRNFAILTENSPNNPPAINGDANGTNGHGPEHVEQSFTGKSGHDYLHKGEVNAGTPHKAASTAHGRSSDGSLDICIRVEIDQHNPEGKTDGYGLTVPTLTYKKPAPGPAPFPPEERSTHSRRTT